MRQDALLVDLREARQKKQFYSKTVKYRWKGVMLSGAVMRTDGRFGAYGPPTDVKVVSSAKRPDNAPGRLLELTFSALSPGQTEVPRRALVAALQPEGSTDVVMLVGGSTSNAWKKAEPAMRSMAASFRVARTRPTTIPRKSKNDFRFEDQGGLKERTDERSLDDVL